MSVGSSAYGHASAMLRMGAQAEGPNVLEELSDKFDRFVVVLGEIADGALASARDDTSMLKAYERWQETGSSRLAESLVEMGFFPMRGTEDVH